MPVDRRAGLAALLAACLLAGCTRSPPVQAISDARQAIAAAREAGAGRNTAATLAGAEARLADAERALRAGAYGSARRAATDAKETAFQALLESRAARGGAVP
jgi:HD superfamily phosphodiesterase